MKNLEVSENRFSYLAITFLQCQLCIFFHCWLSSSFLKCFCFLRQWPKCLGVISVLYDDVTFCRISSHRTDVLQGNIICCILPGRFFWFRTFFLNFQNAYITIHVFCKAEAMVIKIKKNSDKRLNKSDYFICGAFAGFAGSFVEGPIDLVRIALYPWRILSLLNLIILFFNYS